MIDVSVVSDGRGAHQDRPNLSYSAGRTKNQFHWLIRPLKTCRLVGLCFGLCRVPREGFWVGSRELPEGPRMALEDPPGPGQQIEKPILVMPLLSAFVAASLSMDSLSGGSLFLEPLKLDRRCNLRLSG
jgi:hypothetical protein